MGWATLFVSNPYLYKRGIYSSCRDIRFIWKDVFILLWWFT